MSDTLPDPHYQIDILAERAARLVTATERQMREGIGVIPAEHVLLAFIASRLLRAEQLAKEPI